LVSSSLLFDGSADSKTAASYYHMPWLHVTLEEDPAVSRIALIGGTGNEGRGLAVRFAFAGEEVIVGSRDSSRAQEAAAVVRAQLGGGGERVFAGTNAEAAGSCDLACICLPVAGIEATLGELRPRLSGKTVIEVVNGVHRTPAGFEPVALPAPSAAEWVAALLPDSAVVSAFKTVSAKHMYDIRRTPREDTLVCGDDRDAKRRIIDLIGRIAMLRPIDCGPLRNARYVEAATVLLLELNRQHRITASLRVLGYASDTPG
jgi:hypothetical protein